MTAHVVVKILERDMHDRAHDASEVLPVLQTKRENNVFYVFVYGLVVDSDEVVFEVVQVLHWYDADVAV